MVAEESDGSMQWFHFFDGIFLGQWYPEGFHAKSMVLKRFPRPETQHYGTVVATHEQAIYPRTRDYPDFFPSGQYFVQFRAILSRWPGNYCGSQVIITTALSSM